MNEAKVFFAVAFLTLILYGVYSWKKFEYDECRSVGHSTLYCVAKIAD